MDEKRDYLRHCLATLAYRSSKVLREVPEGFGEFHIRKTTRTPGEILAHLGDLIDWACYLVQGLPGGRNTEPLAWEEGVARFFGLLERLDQYLSSPGHLACPEEQLFQGPIADALTHVGQIAMLRRMAGGTVRGENYFVAEIVVGRVGRQQGAPRREFD